MTRERPSQTGTDQDRLDRLGQTRQTDRCLDTSTHQHRESNRIRHEDKLKQAEYYRRCGGDSSLRSTVWISESVVTVGVREEDQDSLNLNLDQTEEDSSGAENQRLERNYLQLFRV